MTEGQPPSSSSAAAARRKGAAAAAAAADGSSKPVPLLETALLDFLSQYEPGVEVSFEKLQERGCELFSCSRLVPPAFAPRRRVVAITKSGGVVDIAPHAERLGHGKIVETHHVTGLTAIKYNRGSSTALVSLTFKSAAVLNYQLADPAPLVDALQHILNLFGLRGEKKRNAVDATHIQTAEDFLAVVRDIEVKFAVAPHVRHIEKIMDLLREATEKFAEVGDDRYTAVLGQMQNFLRRKDVLDVLDAAAAATKLPQASASAVAVAVDEAPAPTPAAGTATADTGKGAGASEAADASQNTSSTSSVSLRLAMEETLRQELNAAAVASKARGSRRVLLSRQQSQRPQQPQEPQQPQQVQEHAEIAGPAVLDLHDDDQEDEDEDDEEGEFQIGSLASLLPGGETDAAVEHELSSMLVEMQSEFNDLMHSFAVDERDPTPPP